MSTFFNVLTFELIYNLLLNDMTAVNKDGDLNASNMNHGGTLIQYQLILSSCDTPLQISNGQYVIGTTSMSLLLRLYTH